jgi:hypothetical protein
MVDAIDVVGDADLVRDTFRAYATAGVDQPVLMPLPWGTDRKQVVDDTMRATVRALQAGDPRIRFFDMPKGPRRGELNRDWFSEHNVMQLAVGRTMN